MSDEKRTYKPDSIFQLLGFVKQAAKESEYNYTNIELRYNAEKDD